MYYCYNQKHISKKVQKRILLLGGKLMFVLETKFLKCIFH